MATFSDVLKITSLIMDNTVQNHTLQDSTVETEIQALNSDVWVGATSGAISNISGSIPLSGTTPWLLSSGSTGVKKFTGREYRGRTLYFKASSGQIQIKEKIQ